MFKKAFSLPLVRRKMIVVWGALLFGVLDVWYTVSQMPEEATTPFIWSIMLHYLALGMLVFLGGFFTVHPVFGFRIAAWWRGPIMSFLITFYSATGSLMHPIEHMGKWEVFWWIVISGAIIGMILDLCGTRWGGEGTDLLKQVESPAAPAN